MVVVALPMAFWDKVIVEAVLAITVTPSPIVLAITTSFKFILAVELMPVTVGDPKVVVPVKVKGAIVDACTFKEGGILKTKMNSCMCGGPLYKKKSGGKIHIKPENKGKFTASAKKAKMGVQEFANHVLANKEDYSSTQVKRANFARNASKWKH